MPETVLLIDSDTAQRTALRARLAEAGPWAVKEAAEASIAQLLAQGDVELVLCADNVRPGGLLASCRWAQAMTSGRVPVLMLADPATPDSRQAAFAAGARDLVPPAVSAAELACRLSVHLRLRRAEQEVVALREQQRHLSLHDPLTGLLNREHFLLACRRELAAVSRHGLTLSALMIDLDNHGADGVRGDLHQRLGMSAADALIMNVGQRLESQLRGGDTLSRLASARFCALLPQTPLATAHTVGERLRTSVLGLACASAGRITVSLGLAAAPVEAAGSVDALLAAAEANLREARAAGGNRMHA